MLCAEDAAFRFEIDRRIGAAAHVVYPADVRQGAVLVRHHDALDLGVQVLEILGELAPGIPFGEVEGGALAGVAVVTKSGAFGSSDTLIRIVDALSTAAT